MQRQILSRRRPARALGGFNCPPRSVPSARGGAPVMHAVAAFQQATGIPAEIVAGPTPTWAVRVAGRADLAFSGAEYMMDDFAGQFREALLPEAYTRYAKLRDLLVRPPAEARILATGGTGQVAFWEDITGRVVLVAPDTSPSMPTSSRSRSRSGSGVRLVL